MKKKKSEEALPMVQKKHDLWRHQNERKEARRLWKLEKGKEGAGLAASYLFGTRRNGAGIIGWEAGGARGDDGN